MTLIYKTIGQLSRLLCVITFLIIFCTIIVQSENFGNDACSSKVTCGECIQLKNCAWCMQESFDHHPRCFQSASGSTICPHEFIYNPYNKEERILIRELTRGVDILVNGSSYNRSSAYSSEYGSGNSGYVQISPQRVGLKLRIGEIHNLHFQYSQVEDFPVDLYYLMDLSKSMEHDKDKLSQLGEQLADAMTNITNNFRIGFGSFVNQVLMPNVSSPQKLIQPRDQCARPSYRNHMHLSTNTSQFSNEVKSGALSANLDAKYGGSDAIMQAIVCHEEIGWRQGARRVLVFATNDLLAGDGELGAVIAPNDGFCHLDRYGTYTHSTLQDHPTISQINAKVKEHRINIIFAVTAQQIQFYQNLSNHIEGSSMGILANDSSNVVELLKSEYNKITSSIEMKDNSTENVKITYYSSCLTDRQPRPTNKCDNLKVGDIVNFEARIVVNACPANPAEWHQTLNIYPVGVTDSLIVDFEMLCQCPCEVGPLYEEKSSKCNYHGTYKCGICDCGLGFYGKHCECLAYDTYKHNNECRQNGTEIICNGRGNCVCGVCECDKRPIPNEIVFGNYCECDNFSCDRHNKQLCSGPDHGTCECGQCVCKTGWTGSSCDCRALTDTCIQPGSDDMCSGHGDCICGKCKCKKSHEGLHYSGAYCENCPTCAE